MTDDTKPAPLAPNAPTTRANLAQSLADVCASLPMMDAATTGLCINDGREGGPLTYMRLTNNGGAS